MIYLTSQLIYQYLYNAKCLTFLGCTRKSRGRSVYEPAHDLHALLHVKNLTKIVLKYKLFSKIESKVGGNFRANLEYKSVFALMRNIIALNFSTIFDIIYRKYGNFSQLLSTKLTRVR